jgi:hypothetical protein
VRPSDGKQRGSTRPNLMSSSRGAAGGEDNILARLERDGARRHGGKLTQAGQTAWFGAAGALIMLLLGALAWLVHENAAGPRSVPAASAALVASAAMAAPARFAPPAPTVEAQAPASIVDQAAELPPMVTLAPEREARPEPAAASSPTQQRAAYAPRAPTRPLVAAGRKARPAQAASPAEPEAADNDVRLLSAIIMHASGHAEERARREATDCAEGKKCPAKATGQP